MELNFKSVSPQSDSKALTNVDTYSCNNNLLFNFRFPSFLASVKIANCFVGHYTLHLKEKREQ